MTGWHQLNRHVFEQTLGDSEGQEGLVCHGPWGQQRVGHDSAAERQQAALDVVLTSSYNL